MGTTIKILLAMAFAAAGLAYFQATGGGGPGLRGGADVEVGVKSSAPPDTAMRSALHQL